MNPIASTAEKPPVLPPGPSHRSPVAASLSYLERVGVIVPVALLATGVVITGLQPVLFVTLALFAAVAAPFVLMLLAFWIAEEERPRALVVTSKRVPVVSERAQNADPRARLM